MINHPLTILQRISAFAKPGLIHPNPLLQVLEATCQVQRRQPVLIPYQIREVSVSRRSTSASPPSLNLPRLPELSAPTPARRHVCGGGGGGGAAEPLPGGITSHLLACAGAKSILQEGLVSPRRPSSQGGQQTPDRCHEGRWSAAARNRSRWLGGRGVLGERSQTTTLFKVSYRSSGGC